jgi:hypothetical protein
MLCQHEIGEQLLVCQHLGDLDFRLGVLDSVCVGNLSTNEHE